MTNASSTPSGTLLQQLADDVRRYGEDYALHADYYSNEFGVYADEAPVTRVFNFFDNGGCHYVHDTGTPASPSPEYTLVLLLYLTVLPDGDSLLMCYLHTNDGTDYDACACDTFHLPANRLSLSELETIRQRMLEEIDGGGCHG